MIDYTVLTYLLRLTTIWFLLIGFYQLIIIHKHNWFFRRYFLILSYLLGVILPLLPSLGAVPYENALNVSGIIAIGETIGTTQPTVPQTAPSQYVWIVIFLLGLYIVYSLFRLSRLFFSHFTIWKWSKTGKISRYRSFQVVTHEQISTPFAALRAIFLPKSIDPKEKEMICLHESIHLRSAHNLERLLLQIGGIILWFHPLQWIFESLLEEVQEFEADEGVLQEFPAAQYGRLLIQTSMLPNIVHGQPGIFSSPLKKRISMMVKNKDYRPLQFRHSLSLLALVMLLTFSCSDLFKNQTDSIFASTEVDHAASLVVPIEQEGMNPSKFLLQSIYTEIKYPAAARNTGTEGLFKADLFIDEQGNLTDLYIREANEAVKNNKKSNDAEEWNDANKKIVVVGYGSYSASEEVDMDGLEALKKELDRVIRNLGPWQPAIKDGNPVSSRNYLTFRYRLEDRG